MDSYFSLKFKINRRVILVMVLFFSKKWPESYNWLGKKKKKKHKTKNKKPWEKKRTKKYNNRKHLNKKFRSRKTNRDKCGVVDVCQHLIVISITVFDFVAEKRAKEKQNKLNAQLQSTFTFNGRVLSASELSQIRTPPTSFPRAGRE